MKKLFNILILLLVTLISTTCKKDEEITITQVSVSQKVEALQTKVKITAYVECNSIYSGVEIMYDTLSSCDNGNVLSMEKGESDNQYSATLKDLVPNKTYYAKYKILNKINYLWSNRIEEFKTLECTVPIVSTDSIKMTGVTSCEIYSYVISDGGLEISEQGVCYGKTKMPTIQDANKMVGAKDAKYVCTVNNLDFNTTYYLRSYAINSLGISYGNELEYATVEEKLDVSPESKTFYADGGSFGVVVTSNSMWTASSDQNWCALSKTSGSGSESFEITVAPTEETTSSSAVVSIKTKNGLQKNVEIIRIGGPMTVTDCQGYTYPVVKIGSQYWMAENLQCTKYDTQSERAGETLQTSDSHTYAPYYTDASDKSKWDSESQTYGVNLSDAQVAKLGYLYNWAAAMGYTESQAMSQTGSYSGRRQGICPNGWHLPNRAEWNTLAEKLGGDDIAGGKLKSRSGWYNGGNGTDDYGFSGLPAGYASGSSVYSVGGWDYFGSSDAGGSDYAYLRYLYYNYSYLYEFNNYKTSAHSVRCLRD